MMNSNNKLAIPFWLVTTSVIMVCIQTVIFFVF